MTKVKTKDKKDYKQSLKDLLDNYEDGWDIFKKAKHWDYPVKKKESAKDDQSLPGTWLELADKAISIIATEKYGLDCYDNTIEIITSNQMLDNYASVGMPISYEHWSFGKQRVLEEKQYKQGKKGLAYEIVINTDPAIAYCMEGNSPLMQMLVIAHASYGHNSFFKGNYMFKQFTDATNILGDLQRLKDFIHDCEEKYGYEEVEKLLDACHAMKMMDVNRYTKPTPKTVAEKKARADRLREERFATPEKSEIWDNIRPKASFEDKSKETSTAISANGEENILKYIAQNAPHLPQWKRQIMMMMADKAQYFYPQMQTQVMNEGWASFWHYTILNDMADLDLIDDKMVAEFLDSHAGVLFQPEFDSPYFSGRMNPYALGFAIFQDIKRICENPTDEDREWFPDIAGSDDWLSVFKEAMHDFKDESFIMQYLSPKLIRDFKFFVLSDDEENDFVEISAIHNTKGYRDVREALASNYRLGANMPYIEAHEYNYKTDRSLILHHKIHKGKPLDAQGTRDVLRHLYQLWEHPVVIKSIDPKGQETEAFSCPPAYAREVANQNKQGPSPKP